MKKDCFAYRGKFCSALTELLCANGNDCLFYKTSLQMDLEQARAQAMISRLPTEKRIRIRQKYRKA